MLRDIGTKPAVTLTAEAPIGEAASLMRDKNVGDVVVVTGNRPGGIVTDLPGAEMGHVASALSRGLGRPATVAAR